MAVRVTHCMLKAVVDMVLNQRLFGLLDGFFDGMQLLGHSQALLTFLQHRNHADKVPICTFKTLDQCRMACVDMWFSHGIREVQKPWTTSPLGG